jgi:hypothetical protein
MQTKLAAVCAGLLLATPALAQAPNVQQLLGGLLTGNQNQDQAVRDAFERGYRQGRDDQGREDEAHRTRYERRRDERDEQSPGRPPYGQPGYGQPGYGQPGYGAPQGAYDNR